MRTKSKYIADSAVAGVLALVLTLIIGLTLIGCGAMGKTLIVSGESLKGLGNQFVAVAAAYKQGCDVTKVIPQPQCQSFRTFGTHFQRAYPLNVQIWEAARSANDASMTGKVEDIVNDLAVSLSGFAVSVAIVIGGR